MPPRPTLLARAARRHLRASATSASRPPPQRRLHGQRSQAELAAALPPSTAPHPPPPQRRLHGQQAEPAAALPLSALMDVEALRRDTPGVVAMGEEGAFLNSAGASLMPQIVLDTQIIHLRMEAELGGYEAAASQGCTYPHATGRVGAVYESVARLVGAEVGEIALVENATVAWQLAFYAVSLPPPQGPRHGG